MSIGRIRSHSGDDPYSITFVTKSRDALRLGEFVYYDDPHQDDRVLCRVLGRRSMEHPDDAFFTSGQHGPDALLGMTTTTPADLDDFIVEARILGCSDPQRGFRVPRDPAPVGAPVHVADDAFLEQSINKAKVGAPGSIHIGTVLDRPNGARIILDGKSIVSTHLAVLATTGAGKSYMMGVVLEELLRSATKYACLVFDFHGEYPAMVDAASVLADGAYRPKVEVVTPETLQIPFSILTGGDIVGLLPGLTDNMVSFIHAAYGQYAQSGVRTPNAFAQAMQAVAAQGNLYDEKTVRAVERRFRHHVQHRPYFVSGQGTTLRRLIQPGQLTVLNLNGLGEDTQDGVCNLMLNLVLKARMGGRDQDLDKFFDLPWPVFTVIEEAHRIASPDGGKQSTRTVKKILAEGRKFGVGCGIVTQRPGKVHPDVLSQCLTQVIGRILNPVDQEQIRQSAEAASADLLKVLPSLATGEAVVFGSAIATPTIASIRQRLTSVGGSSGDPVGDSLRAYENLQVTGTGQSSTLPPTSNPDAL